MRTLIKTLLISMAVAGWLIISLVLLKHLPIEVFPAWPILSAAGFGIYLTYQRRGICDKRATKEPR